MPRSPRNDHIGNGTEDSRCVNESGEAQVLNAAF